MARPLLRQIDALNRKPFINVAPGTATGEVVTFEQLNSAIEGVSWKDNVRAATTVNITLATPGASIDAITLAVNDRFLVKNQTTQTENGIYIFTGAASPATRALDASTFDELESAVVTVDEGTSNGGTTWRQTQVNGVIGTNIVVFTAFGTGVAAASETVAGVVELATQAETDAGTDPSRAITPATLAGYAGRAKRFSATIGDGSQTSLVVTHNLNTRDVSVSLFEATGTFREVMAEVQLTSVNSVTFLFDVAPASNAYRATIVA